MSCLPVFAISQISFFQISDRIEDCLEQSLETLENTELWRIGIHHL